MKYCTKCGKELNDGENKGRQELNNIYIEIIKILLFKRGIVWL